MAIYAYNNPNNDLGQILSIIVPLGVFAGKRFDEIVLSPEKTQSGRSNLPAQQHKELIEKVSTGDVVITSTLTNFSIDFIAALQVVSDLDQIGVRIIALQEEFDSSRLRERVLLYSLPMMHKFRRNAFKAKRQNRNAGIRKAAEEGRLRGRKTLTPADFPNFSELYNLYMFREIGKGEFAKRLGVSRPTLDRLIDDLRNKKG